MTVENKDYRHLIGLFKRIYRRSSSTSSVRLRVPAQPVNATPSSALIRQCLRGRTVCLATLSQNLARAAFRPVQPFQAILDFVFNARRVLA
jgi:hypothetical protein